MEVREKNNFKGLYVTIDLKMGTSIYVLKGDILDKPTRTSIEIGVNKHIEDIYGSYMNHSFSPNCKIEEGYIITLTAIKANEELTFNYNNNETKMASPFIDIETNIIVSGKNEI
jgi:hypothetical protein